MIVAAGHRRSPSGAARAAGGPAMTRARVAAALAAILTALLLQATVIAPATVPWPVSLPAVLVAAVALVDGPATGMSFGFAAGLIADLGSHHPAGVLALCWLGVGPAVRDAGRPAAALRRDALIAGVACDARRRVAASAAAGRCVQQRRSRCATPLVDAAADARSATPSWRWPSCRWCAACCAPSRCAPPAPATPSWPCRSRAAIAPIGPHRG